MNISELGKAWLMKEEAVRLFPYNDKTGRRINKWNPNATIGVGYLIPENEWERFSQGITEETALHLMDNTLLRFEKSINTHLLVGVTQAQFDALCVFCYNVGTTAFENSSMLKMINKQVGSRYPTLKDAWLAYCKDDGKFSQGLYNRRTREYAVFSCGYVRTTW